MATIATLKKTTQFQLGFKRSLYTREIKKKTYDIHERHEIYEIHEKHTTLCFTTSL